MSDGVCGIQDCPHSDKIKGLYDLVYVGNGEGPLRGRVKQLEAEMVEVLPILRDLRTAADRQDGRDAQRLEDEQKRDKDWARFRQAIITIATVIGIVIAALTYIKQIHTGLLVIPQIIHSDVLDRVYADTRKP